VYRVQGRVQTVTFKADRNDDAVMLHLESATPDASIYYEEVENDPRPSSSKEYLGPLRLRSRMVRAMAVKQGMTPSRFSNFVLHEQVQPPVPRVEGTFAMSSSLDEAPVLVYKDEATVTLSHADADKPDYTVYYSVDGNPPTTLSPKYRKPITVKRAGTHRMCFIAMVPMLADSNEAWVEFTIMNQVPPPRISPPQGCFLLRVDGDNVVRVHKQQVTIAFEAAAPCTDAAAAPAGGASVFFTLDGQPPVATGPHLPRDPNTYLYDTPLHLSRIDPSHFGEGAPLANFSCDPLVPLRIKVCARAAQQGLIDSVETRAEIEMLDQVSAPTSTPEPKLYPELVDTSLFCVTPGATIYYTLDGSDPGALHAANRDSGAPPTPTSPSSPASPNTPPAHAAGHSDAHAPMLGISVAQEHQLTRENSHTQSLAGVREYTGMFRITEVGYTQVRAIAVRQDMWDSEEFECKYGVEAQVMVWGSGRNGRLGTGSMRDTSFPLRCAQLYGHILTHVACGRAHSIMCNDRGEVLTFGLGLQSRLGRPVERGGSCLLPTLVPGLDSVFVVAVAAGERHTLLLSREGNVYSFGEGSRGQLGHGEDVHTKPGDKGLAAPTRIEAFKYFGKNPPPSRKPTVTKQPVRMIACGSCHSMALTTDGLVWMWGRGKEGQLGNGQRTDIFEPLAPMATLVEGQPQGLYAKHVVHVSGSDWHSAFVCQDGEVFTCGRGIEGQLGVEEVSFCLFPQRVHALARQGVKICQAACGREHTLFLDTRNQVWACGNPENGRLGIAPRPDKSGCRVSAAMTAGEVKASFQKRAISGKQHGSSHSLIRGESFKTWSGEDVGSAVGLGGNERAAMATMVPELVVGLPKPGSSSPSTSSPASPGDKEGQVPWVLCLICGLLFPVIPQEPCQLSIKVHAVAANLERIVAPAARQVRSLLASSDNSAVVFEDGRVFVWGKNEKGALGLDDTQDRFAPTLLFTIHGLPIKELAVGGDHMVALIATQSSREPGDTATAHSSSPPSPTCSPRAAGGVGELKKTGGSRRSPPATPEGMEGSARVGGAVAAAVKKRGSNSLKKSRTPSPQSASRSASPVNIK
jgi:alpha-tubulin suppressor-like RCC1 family protein